MTLTAENRANLKKLATYLERLPADYDRFNMRHFFAFGRGGDEQKYALHNGGLPCGTVACALGHGPAAGILMPAALVDTYPDWNAYAALFTPGIGSSEYYWLFYDDWDDVDDTPSGAAARIRYLLKRRQPPPSFNGTPLERHVRTYAPFLASVDTLPKGQDSEAGLVRSKGSAVPPEEAADAQTPADNNQ